MTTAEVLNFLRANRLAVQASLGAGDTIQAALVGFAVTDTFEIVFDTLNTTRKVTNLRAAPRIALVIGGWSAGDERTVQYEGIADEPFGDELERLKERVLCRLAGQPESSGVARAGHIRVRPTWVRYRRLQSDAASCRRVHRPASSRRAD